MKLVEIHILPARTRGLGPVSGGSYDNNNNNNNESLFDQKIKTHILCYNIN